MSAINAALAAIESLKPEESFSYAQIARDFGVEPTTLARRHRGTSSARNTKIQNQLALHPQQEEQLVRYIQRLTEQGIPPTRSMIRNFASQVAKKQLGYH